MNPTPRSASAAASTPSRDATYQEAQQPSTVPTTPSWETSAWPSSYPTVTKTPG